MLCEKCGYLLKEGTKTCTNCGNIIENEKSSIKKNTSNKYNTLKLILMGSFFGIIINLLILSSSDFFEFKEPTMSVENKCKALAEIYIEKNLKNPDSLKVIDESFEKLDKGSVVHITYRATNSFNAVVTESIKVYFDENNIIVGAM